MISVLVTNQALDAAVETQRMQASTNSHMGAIASFCGLMRDHNEGDQVAEMTLEHYPGMTENALHSIAQQAMARWKLGGVRIVHRYGHLKPADPIVYVATSSEHRSDAFSACEFIMDYLKTEAPFWKKEQSNQQSHWVEAKQADDLAKQRWKEAQ